MCVTCVKYLLLQIIKTNKQRTNFHSFIACYLAATIYTFLFSLKIQCHQRGSGSFEELGPSTVFAQGVFLKQVKRVCHYFNSLQPQGWSLSSRIINMKKYTLLMAVYKRKRQNYCKGDSINAFNHEIKIFIQILNWRVLFLSFVVHRCCSSSSLNWKHLRMALLKDKLLQFRLSPQDGAKSQTVNLKPVWYAYLTPACKTNPCKSHETVKILRTTLDHQ